MAHVFLEPSSPGNWVNYWVEVKWFDSTDSLVTTYLDLHSGWANLDGDLESKAREILDIIMGLDWLSLDDPNAPVSSQRVYSISNLQYEYKNYDITEQP